MKTHIWPLLATRAALALLFGLLTLAWPGITLLALVVLFGAWCLVDGVSLAISTVRGDDDRRRRWADALGAVASVGLGVVTLVWPGLTALGLTILIGAWLVASGAAETIAAIRWRQVLTREWVLVLSGVLSIVLGIVLLAAPAPGAFALSQVIGIYAIVYAAMLGTMAVRVHHWEREHPTVGFRAASATG
jgi:uncharacterized membrane protein HdeD (DUF308 family)